MSNNRWWRIFIESLGSAGSRWLEKASLYASCGCWCCVCELLRRIAHSLNKDSWDGRVGPLCPLERHGLSSREVNSVTGPGRLAEWLYLETVFSCLACRRCAECRVSWLSLRPFCITVSSLFAVSMMWKFIHENGCSADVLISFAWGVCRGTDSAVWSDSGCRTGILSLDSWSHMHSFFVCCFLSKTNDVVCRTWRDTRQAMLDSRHRVSRTVKSTRYLTLRHNAEQAHGKTQFQRKVSVLTWCDKASIKDNGWRWGKKCYSQSLIRELHSMCSDRCSIYRLMNTECVDSAWMSSTFDSWTIAECPSRHLLCLDQVAWLDFEMIDRDQCFCHRQSDFRALLSYLRMDEDEELLRESGTSIERHWKVVQSQWFATYLRPFETFDLRTVLCSWDVGSNWISGLWNMSSTLHAETDTMFRTGSFTTIGYSSWQKECTSRQYELYLIPVFRLKRYSRMFNEDKYFCLRLRESMLSVFLFPYLIFWCEQNYTNIFILVFCVELRTYAVAASRRYSCSSSW